MPEFHAGNQGTATINGVELAVMSWNVAPVVELARFRNSKTAGFTKKEATWKDATFTITVEYDFLANPFAVLPAATTVTNVKLYLRGTSGPYWLFPSAIVVGDPQSVDVDGKIGTSFSLEADGTFARPA